MRTILLASVLSIAALAGCAKSTETPQRDETTEAASSVPTVSVDQLDTMMASSGCQAVDANGEGTRKKMGIIPGAVLLSDSDTFTAKELPADKTRPLVFYCVNTHCGASHEAAEKAITAGYTNVKVLPDGIAGWVKAGKKVTQI
ncbi:MAG: rhodanese-like domain-containing protein [Deltaproteobacteria bacterium]|nr:rhodanese-like domain-containing protein [Deltaproteobacteria bacterium]